jgi:hypothetical protein
MPAELDNRLRIALHDASAGAVRAGDFLLVAAGAPHAFETFTDDFKTWVILFGPKGGYQGKHSRSSASPP